MQPGQGRNLADLIAAKIAAHEKKAQFKDIEPQTPRPPSLPPKVVEVYTK
jgi:hypothetical protein